MEIVTKSVAETQAFGKTVSQKLTPGMVVTLRGDLGSGKTTFMQGVLAGLGITQRVTSPTFVFMKLYKTPDGTTLFHFDLYRVQSEKDIEALGMIEMMNDPAAITFIEWPEKMGSLLPKNAKVIMFTTINETERKIYADWF